MEEDILLVKFYNINYDRHIKPVIWLKKLRDVLEIKNNNTFKLLASYIANTILKDSDLFQKKKFYKFEGGGGQPRKKQY